MNNVMNISIVQATKLKYATQVMVDKVDDNLKLNGKYTHPNENDEDERSCHEFVKKYKGITFPVYVDVMGNATNFMKIATKHVFGAKYCKSKGFMDSMVCLMKINNDMQGAFQEKYVQLAPMDKIVNETLKIVGNQFKKCLKCIETLPKIKQPFDDLKAALALKTINQNVPCQITLAIVNNETGEVKGAPCYKNVTKD